MKKNYHIQVIIMLAAASGTTALADRLVLYNDTRKDIDVRTLRYLTKEKYDPEYTILAAGKRKSATDNEFVSESPLNVVIRDGKSFSRIKVKNRGEPITSYQSPCNNWPAGASTDHNVFTGHITLSSEAAYADSFGPCKAPFAVAAKVDSHE